MDEKNKENEAAAGCGIPVVCARTVPGWLVVLDNAPTAILFVLGAALLAPLGRLFAALFLAYCALAIVLFWRRICPSCHHFGTRACPCGYGVIASRFFRRRPGRDFKQVFRRNIAIMFPCWFVPLGPGVWLLYSRFSTGSLVLLCAFCFVGFVAIPLIAKLVGCRNCGLKNDCPWMAGKPTQLGVMV